MKSVLISSFAIAVVATVGLAGAGSAKAIDETLYSKPSAAMHAVLAGEASVSGKLYVDGSTVTLANNAGNTKTRTVDFTGGLGGSSKIFENGNLHLQTDDNLYLDPLLAGGKVVISGAGKLEFTPIAGQNPVIVLNETGKSPAGVANRAQLWADDGTGNLYVDSWKNVYLKTNSEYNGGVTVTATSPLDQYGSVGGTLALGKDSSENIAVTTWFRAGEILSAGDLVKLDTTATVPNRTVIKITAAADDWVGVVTRDAVNGAQVEVAVAGVVNVKVTNNEALPTRGLRVQTSDTTDGAVMLGETAARGVGVVIGDSPSSGGKAKIVLQTF